MFFFTACMNRKICILTLALLAAVSSLAQTVKRTPAPGTTPIRPAANGGTVAGTVKDLSGAVIQGAP